MWQSRSKEVTCYPKGYYSPNNVEEISEIIKQAKSKGVSVRAVGQAYTFSPIIGTDGYLINTDKLTNIQLGPTLDETKYGNLNHTVRCQAGASINQVNNFLTNHGLVIGSNVVLTSVRIAGICATGSHGTGINYRTISDRIYEIRIVDSDGNLRTYNEDTTQPDVMSAVKVSLGAFGIIYDIVLRVEKDTNITTVNRTIPFADLIDDEGQKLGQLINDKHNEWLEFYWFPFSKSVLVKQSARTDEQISWFAKQLIYIKFFIQAFISTFHAYASYCLFYLNYKYVKFAGSNGYVMFSSYEQVQPLKYGVHYTGLIDYNPIICNPECTIGFNNNAEGYAKIAKCIDDARNLIDVYYSRGMSPCVYGINIRFTAASNCLISPANMDNDLIMWIEAFAIPKMDGYVQFCNDFNVLMINKYQGMCHWPKSWNYTTIDTVTKNYGSRLQQFNQIRTKLDVDPTNMFLNTTLRYVFDVE